MASKIQAVDDSSFTTLELPDRVILAAKLELCQKMGGERPCVKEAFEREQQAIRREWRTIFQTQMNGIAQLPEKVKAQEMASLDHELLQAFKKLAGQIVESKSHLDGCAAPEICNLMETWQQRLQEDLKRVFDRFYQQVETFVMTINEFDITGDWLSSEPCQHLSAFLDGGKGLELLGWPVAGYP